MKMLLKILAGLVAVALLIVVILAVAVTVIIDPEDYRDAVVDAVADETGRTLRINTLPSLRLVPCCGIRLEQVHLSGPPGFPDTGFASLEHADIGLQLWPLLTEQAILIDRVRIDGLEVHLARTADGVVNWLPAGSVAGTAAPGSPDNEPLEMPDFSIDGIAVSNSSVTWNDAASGAHYRLDGLSIETGPVTPGRPFALDARFGISDVNTGNTASLALSSSITIDPAGTLLELEDPRLDADLGDGTAAGAVHLGADRVTLDTGSGATITSGRARLESGGLVVQITAGGTVGAEFRDLSGTIEIPAFSPREALAATGRPPIPTADPDALATAALNANWTVDNDGARLERLELRLDQTRLTGELSVSDFSEPRYAFALVADALDLDRYLAPDTGDDTDTAATEPADEFEWPMEALRAVRLDGSLDIGQLEVNDLKLTGFSTRVHADGGQLAIAPIAARLYDGEYTGRIDLDFTGDVTRLSLEQEISGVQAGGMLADMDAADNLSGVLAARLQAAARGNTERAIRQSLSGDLSFSLADGVYEGMDIWHEIRVQRARLKGKPPPVAAEPQHTDITALEFAGQMTNGVLHADRMIMQIPFIRLTGTGSANLVDQTLDYRFKARVFEEPQFADGKNLRDLMGVSIPIIISGQMEHPDIRVDLGEAVKKWAVNKLSERLIDRLGLQDKPGATDQQAAPEEKESPRDQLKRALKDLLKPR